MIVFVHGVPETAGIWRGMQDRLDRPSTALALPGFGRPRPDGFTATKDAYVDWLVGELRAIDEPVDLVGHDWGAGLTYRVATGYGEVVRSWAADVGNIAHPDYQWHDIAKIWQTPGDGEAFVESQSDTPAPERAAMFTAMGILADYSLEMAEASDAVMGGCILDLYRSAVPNLHADWGPWSGTSSPGLVVHPVDDPFSDEAMAAATAEMLGARFATIPGAGHFWPAQAPEAGVRVLEEFWAAVTD